MVNDMDHAEDVAKLAGAFEKILLDSRVWVRMLPPISDEIPGHRN